MKTRRDGRPLEATIGLLLIVGVVASIVLIAGGTMVSFLHHPDYVSSRAALTRLGHGSSAPHSIRVVLEGVGHLRGRALVMFGLLLLIATPVARVAASLYSFARARDWTFVLLTSVVLTFLLLSFALGWAVG